MRRAETNDYLIELDSSIPSCKYCGGDYEACICELEETTHNLNALSRLLDDKIWENLVLHSHVRGSG